MGWPNSVSAGGAALKGLRGLKGFRHPEARWLPSPNYGGRRGAGGGDKVDMVVLHATNMNSTEAALARLCDSKAEVSAHYLIGEDGRLWQLVDEGLRAHHAGVGAWGDRTDVNSCSIGIEIANRGDHPFSERQMRQLAPLLQGIMRRWQVPPWRVIGHSDMAPTRKQDPGARFDWRRLALQSLAIWPSARQPTPADTMRFCHLLHQAGYPAAPACALLRSFRLRFRPWAQGPLAPIDMALAADLAQRWPVRRVAPSRGES